MKNGLVTAAGISGVLPADTGEYSILLRPDSLLEEKILAEAALLPEDCRLSAEEGSRPALELVSFRAREAMEETLIRWLHRIAGSQGNAELVLNNYSSLPPRTIYLRIMDPAPIRSWAAALSAIDPFIRSNGDGPLHFPARPMLPLCHRLPEGEEETFISLFSRRCFHEKFLVNRWHLVKTDPLRGCREVAVLALHPHRG